jgi:hypothetical protein
MNVQLVDLWSSSQATIRNAHEALKTEERVEAGCGRGAIWRRLDPPGEAPPTIASLRA